jgi:hypothetical protein
VTGVLEAVGVASFELGAFELVELEFDEFELEAFASEEREEPPQAVKPYSIAMARIKVLNRMKPFPLSAFL